MTARGKVSARMQLAHASTAGQVTTVPLEVVETALMVPVLKDSAVAILDGKVLNVISRRHVLLWITVRQKSTEFAKQRITVNAMLAIQVS